MTVKDANKWLEGVQSVINNTHNIQKACSDNPELWENFAEQCDVNMGYKEFAYIVIDALCGYKNLVKDKIDKAEIKFFD